MLITYLIIAVTAIVSIYGFSNGEIFNKFKFNPYMVSKRGEYVRIFTHALLHADWMHLIVNMFVLYMFGGVVESVFKELIPGAGFSYLLFYILSIPAASIPALIKRRNDHSYNSVGASGAVAAVLFASILIHPEGSVAFFFIPIPIPNPIFAVLYLAYSYFMDKRSKDNIAHDAHFAGAVFGFIVPGLLYPDFFKNFFNYILNWF